MSVTAVILPKLGLTMDEGKLVGWLKREGDWIEAGEILFEVETDKATLEVEAPVAGYVRKLLVAAGDNVPVTQVIALISRHRRRAGDRPGRAGGAQPPAPRRPRRWRPQSPAPQPPAASEAPVAAVESTPRLVSSPPDGERGVASPAARKRAKELGVDLGTVRASKGDRISVEDVEATQRAVIVPRPPMPPARRSRGCVARSPSG